jgi:hypothetical protein
MDGRFQEMSRWKVVEHLLKDEAIQVKHNDISEFIQSFLDETGIPLDYIYIGSETYALQLNVLEDDR